MTPPTAANSRASDARPTRANDPLGFDAPEVWRRLADTAVQPSAVLFLLGQVDTGKSTLARYLIREALRRGHLVALLDTDVGQSVVGPPTTLGLKLLRRSLDELSDPPDALYFAGSISPGNCRTEMVVGARRLADVARTAGADLLVVDTTGMIDGVPGYLLKTAKIECLNATAILAIEATPEGRALRPILRAFERREDLRIHRLVRVAASGTKTSAARRHFRRLSFAAYFAQAEDQTMPLAEGSLSGVPLLRAGPRPDALRDTIAGLQDAHGLTLGIGVLRALDLRAGEAVLFAPPGLVERAHSVRLGDFRLPPIEEVSEEEASDDLRSPADAADAPPSGGGSRR